MIADASGFEGWADHTAAPRNEEELRALLRSGEAVTVRGGGTGVTGGSVPEGGVSISLQHFTKLEIEPGLARVGAGVLLKDLQAAAARAGQFYPPDPTETWASVGGSIATNASGSRSFRYGATRRWIRALRVATMSGETRWFRRGEPIDFAVPALPVPRTTKTTAGYPLQPGMDWVDLFTGSEGTLGIVTEAELTLLPAPGELLTAVVFFAGDPPEDWRAIPGLRMLEYFDAASLRLLGAKGHSAFLVEQEDPDWDAWDQRIAGSVDAWFAAEAADRERIRVFRHSLPEKVNEQVRRRGGRKMGSDFAVPVERNLDMLRLYREVEDCVLFGHYGDAHLHLNLFEPKPEVMVRLAKAAVAMGGTISAEHGLGKSKKHLLPLQFTEAEIEAMRAVKRRLDPCWLLGQGTLLDLA